MKESKNEQTVLGTATSNVTSDVSKKPIARLDGPCITKTLRGIRGMTPEALSAVRGQSQELVGQVLEVYARDVAPGEVGHDGSARAGENHIGMQGPTGLLYGRIQSGKTVAMITFTALAIDNGFRIIIVLTTNFLELVNQTKDRFNDLGRVLVRASTEPEEWTKPAEVEHLRKKVPELGLVFICAKHAGHLQSLRDLLKKLGAGNYPALILDDEADQASLDNNERKRGRAKNPEDVEATVVNQAILDIREGLRHHVFLQVTATPYALLLQRVTSPLRPKFTYLLDPGIGYTGGEDFFSLEHISEGRAHGVPPLIFIREEESEEIEQGPGKAPRGLENAITFFLVAAAAQAIQDPEVVVRSQNFLCHTSHKRAEHDKLHDLIIDFTSTIGDELAPLRGRAESLINWAYGELGKTISDLPSLSEIVDEIIDRLPRRKVRIVNSDGNSGEEVRGAPNFIIGGNIVGRGLTIPNLLVTYYVRKPKATQMDTMLQHARMFGYRRALMPYTRVFLPRSLAIRFWRIHEAESELRGLLPTVDALDKIPVQVVGDLRATRYGVLDTGSVVTIRSGKHMYPLEPDTRLPGKSLARIEQIAKSVWPDWTGVKKEEFGPTKVGLDVIESLLDAMSPSDWDIKAIKLILRSVAGDEARLYFAYRQMRRTGRDEEQAVGRLLPTGALSGEELGKARARSLPTFHLFRQAEKREYWDNDLFFYPTIVFPKAMSNHVYSDTELD